MMESGRGGVKLSFEKVSRGAKPEPLPLVFDEERRLFVPKELDRYVAAFEVGETFTTREFMERVGFDLSDEKQQKTAVDIIRQRIKRGSFEKVIEGKKGQEALWKRAN